MNCSCLTRPHGKRLLLAILAVTVFIFIYEMLFHGMLLSDTYAATAPLWRAEGNMEEHMGWLMLGQFMIAVMFCYLYSFIRTCGGIGGGACYGLMVGLLMSATHLITYAVQPIPGNLIAIWMAGGIVETILAGVIIAFIYPPESD